MKKLIVTALLSSAMLQPALADSVIEKTFSQLQWVNANADDGKEITLTGTMKIGQFAGPPNFESVKDGDKLLTYWYLEASKPLCAVTDPSLEGKKLEKIEPLRYFQLAITQQLDSIVRKDLLEVLS